MNRITNGQAVTSGIAALILFVGAAFAGRALAEDGNGAPPSAAPMATSARDEARIKGLHDRLKLTPAQQPLWDKVAAVMRSNDQQIDALAETRHERASTMTAVEDLRSYGEITEAHAAGIRAFTPAFIALYDSMTAAQKSNADAVFRSDDHKPHRKAS